MPKHPHYKLDFNQITKYIYIGTNTCCQLHFDERLREIGIGADISVEGERLDAPYGVWLYLWLPVQNAYAPTKNQFLAGVAAINQIIKQKNKVFVHCEKGHGRAPTLVAAHLLTQGYTIEKAISLLQEKRPVIHLNKRQINALKKFSKIIKN
ncbi:MAG: dual specificity protein phosphatase family protein [Parcubacteria group bacterium]|nr:dual specificity protein phosphatase family protein [Parcubacteria group bacterium]